MQLTGPCRDSTQGVRQFRADGDHLAKKSEEPLDVLDNPASFGAQVADHAEVLKSRVVPRVKMEHRSADALDSVADESIRGSEVFLTRRRRTMFVSCSWMN